MIISLIAAVDLNNGLGRNNALLCHLPADLKRFKSLTVGKPIIMGRKTYESIGRPLPLRENIVITHEKKMLEGVHIAYSLQEAIAHCSDAPEIMIIGGATLFDQSIRFAERIYLTVIHHQFEADVFFPPINPEEWQCHETLEYPADAHNAFAMTFKTFLRLS